MDKNVGTKNIVKKLRNISNSQQGETVTVPKKMWEFVCDLLETQDRHYKEICQAAAKMFK